MYKDADDRPFACDVDGCGARFKTKSYLTQHVKKEHAEAGAFKATRTVLVRPNARDRMVLNRWFGHARAIYNHTIDYCEKNKVYAYEAVRPKISTESSIPEARAYLRDLPSDVRKLTVKEACNAYKSNFAKRKIDPNHKFKMRFRSRKDRTQQIKIEHRSLTAKNGRLHIFSENKELSGEGFGYDEDQIDLETCIHDFSLERDAEGRFWMHIPITRFPASENQAVGEPEMEIDKTQCALDPGVRTFLTSYSPDGACYKIGDGAATRLYRLMLHLDTLVSDISTCKERRKSLRHRRGLKRAAERLRARIKNLTADLHWKAAKFLCDRYDTIVIPPFGTQKMSERVGRRLRVKTVRQMQVLSHYTFRQRLEHSAFVRGATVAVRGEEYTSKTCTKCGNIHRTLGGAKIYKCSACGVRYDRDAGGARNIFIKNYEF